MKSPSNLSGINLNLFHVLVCKTNEINSTGRTTKLVFLGSLFNRWDISGAGPINTTTPSFQCLHSTVGALNLDLSFSGIVLHRSYYVTTTTCFFTGLILQNKQSYLSSINKAIPGNWTPLHFAAALYKFEVCMWLLEAGVWPDIVTINKETPLSLVSVYLCAADS